jgi:hypothetical protein
MELFLNFLLFGWTLGLIIGAVCVVWIIGSEICMAISARVRGGWLRIGSFLKPLAKN